MTFEPIENWNAMVQSMRLPAIPEDIKQAIHDALYEDIEAPDTHALPSSDPIYGMMTVARPLTKH